MNDGKFPTWFKEYADRYVPANRCTYCWWVRGIGAHALMWDVGVGVLLMAVLPELSWLLRFVLLAVIVYLQMTNTFNRELRKVDADNETTEPLPADAVEREGSDTTGSG